MPELGRWVNRDPINERVGLNLNVFVQNDPVDWVDPWGLFCGQSCDDLDHTGIPDDSPWDFKPYPDGTICDTTGNCGSPEVWERRWADPVKGYEGTIGAWFNNIMHGIANGLGPTGGSISYTMVSPTIFLGSVSLNFKVKAAGQCEKCCDVNTSKIDYQFNGSISLVGSGGIGIGSDAGIGVDVTSINTGKSNIPNCNSTINDINYSLTVVAFAGISSGDWKSTSASFEQKIAECSASMDCRWKFQEGPTASFGGGAVGVRLALAAKGTATGTYWPGEN